MVKALHTLVAFAVVTTITVDAYADVIRMTHGGEVRGMLDEHPATSDGPLKIQTLSGATVRIAREDVDFVMKRSRVIEEYVTQAEQIEPTVENHWLLAEWCRTHLLSQQREEQLELLLEIEPDHADARRVLGHVKHNGQWMSKEEMMAKRGYVRYRNRWVSQQELALIEKNAAEREAELEWFPKVRLWLRWVTGADRGRRQDGIQHFAELRDVDAIPALVKLLSDHQSNDVRLLYVRVLGEMRGAEPIGPLLDRYLFDPNELIRQEALVRVETSVISEAVPLLVTALANDSNEVINRAAYALGKLGDSSAVPALINALVTTHKYKVEVPSGNAMSFGASSNGQVGMVDPRLASGTLPPELAAMARAGQFPYGVQVVPHPITPKRTQVVTVKADIKNASVLAALEHLTGKNLGYNERDWQLWWSIQKS